MFAHRKTNKFSFICYELPSLAARVCKGEYAAKSRVQKATRYRAAFLLCVLRFTSRTTAKHTEIIIKSRNMQANRSSIMSDIP